MTTHGGATDFARVIAICESFGPYCLIGGLAVNCYVEPVYTIDADFVVISASMGQLGERLRELSFKTDQQLHSFSAQAPGSDLRIQFTTDERYQAFLARSSVSEVLGIQVRIASLEDVTQGKLWPLRRPSAAPKQTQER